MDARKNAASLTSDEWSRFLNAVVTLKHTFAPGSTVSVYDQFVAIHWGVTRLTGAQTVNGAHRGPAFLPWHREYLKRLEQALQAVDTSVTIPYWNWGLGPLSETTALFQDDRMGPLGSITSGYFAEAPNALNPLGWPVRPDLRQVPVGGTALRRNATLNTGPGWPTGMTVGNTLALSMFHLFRPALEAFPHHDLIHVRLGGDMVQMTSPNDPIFFLHHCQVDRLWAKWQQDHPGSANYNPLATGGQGHRLNDWMWPWDGGDSQTTVTSISGLIPQFPVTDRVAPIHVLDHHALGYCYDDEPNCPCPDSDDQFPVPGDLCESIRDEIDALRLERELFQEELRSAPPSLRPFLVSQIRELNRQIGQLNVQLRDCEQTPSRVPGFAGTHS